MVSQLHPRSIESTYSINIRISLSLRRALRSIDNILTVRLGLNGVQKDGRVEESKDRQERTRAGHVLSDTIPSIVHKHSK